MPLFSYFCACMKGETIAIGVAVLWTLSALFFEYASKRLGSVNLNLIRLEEQNLSVARENLEIALERYKLGDLSGLDLREVQKSLLDAEERLILVRYQTKVAEISLMRGA